MEEAINAFETRVQACQDRHDDHLHVYILCQFQANTRIVGKGIHSQNHLAKLRPAVEDLCRKRNFKYYVEENEGRILVKFGEGSGQLSQGEAQSFWDKLQNFGSQSGYPGSSQPQYPQPASQQHHYQGQQQQYQGQQQQQYHRPNQNNDMVEEVVRKAAPVIFRKIRSCCVIM